MINKFCPFHVSEPAPCGCRRTPADAASGWLLAALLLGLTLLAGCGGGGHATAAPTGLSYREPSPVYRVGVPIVPNPPACGGGAVTRYGVAPGLPDGLALNEQTGVIQGTPTAPKAAATYRVTANNHAGAAAVDLRIAVVQPEPPAALHYPHGEFSWPRGVAIPPAAPASGGGGKARYSVSPDLPAGLRLDPDTGAITGTPATPSLPATYRITASNAGGSVHADLTLAVTDPAVQAPAGLHYAASAWTLPVDAASTRPAPALDSGTATRFSVHPALPDGLQLDPGTGAVTGAPRVPAASATYRITATNAGGSTHTNLTIAVTPKPTPQALPSQQAPPQPPPSQQPPPQAPPSQLPPPQTPPSQPPPQTPPSQPPPSTPPPALAGLSYTQASPVYRVGAALGTGAFPANAPTLAQGTATRFEVAPPLPAGLDFDPATGRITGTPSVAAAAAVHRVTAFDAAGASVQVDLNLSVLPPALAGLSYTQANPVYQVGVALGTGSKPVNVATLAQGAATRFQVAPALPAGLDFDPTTGRITGTPTVAAVAAVHRVTATDAGGASAHADLNLTVLPAAPENLDYPYPRMVSNYPVGIAIRPATPVVTGTVDRYEIAPPLPAGLLFDTATGTISGVPTAASPWPSDHAVTAINAGGSCTTHIRLQVDNHLFYSRPLSLLARNFAVPPNGPANGGGIAATYAIAPPLPAGLHFNANTGEIYGTPTVALGRTTCTVTATDATDPSRTATGRIDLIIQTARHEAFALPFVVSGPGMFTVHNRLDFPERRRTLQYRDMELPKAPVLHPYHADQGLDPGILFPAFTLNLQFPSTFYEALPQPVKARVAAWGIPPGQVDIICVSEQNAWVPGTTLLFRPHYWTDPDAPWFGNYSTGRYVHGEIFLARAGIRFRRVAAAPGAVEIPAGPTFQDNISVHPASIGPVAPLIVSSGDTQAMEGFPAGRSVSFWSLTQVNGGRAVATLHLLVNAADRAILDVIAHHATNLNQLVDQMNHRLAGRRALRLFKDLTRPLVATAVTTAAGGHATVTLRGSCLGHASEVRIGTQPATITSNDDESIVATVPVAPASGNHVRIVTPMGVDDSFRLP
jgi:hypothetical protein